MSSGGPGSDTGQADTIGDPAEGTDDGDDNAGCGFVSCPKLDIQTPEYETCDVWGQDCGGGKKCVPTLVAAPMSEPWVDWVCVPVAEQTVPEGSRCETTMVDGVRVDDCAADAVCHDVNPQTGRGVCSRLCAGDPQAPQCGGDERCWFSSGGLYALCLPTCDPLAMPHGCGTQRGCVPFVDGGYYTDFVCFPPHQSKPAGTPCYAANGCADGLMCLDAYFYGGGCTSEACCTPLCRVGEPNPVCEQPGHECVAMFAPGHPDLAHVGRCQAP